MQLTQVCLNRPREGNLCFRASLRPHLALWLVVWTGRFKNCYRATKLAVSGRRYNSENHWNCVVIFHRTTRRMYHSRSRSTTLCMNILVRLVIQTARGLTLQHISIGIVSCCSQHSNHKLTTPALQVYAF